MNLLIDEEPGLNVPNTAMWPIISYEMTRASPNLQIQMDSSDPPDPLGSGGSDELFKMRSTIHSVTHLCIHSLYIK